MGPGGRIRAAPDHDANSDDRDHFLGVWFVTKRLDQHLAVLLNDEPRAGKQNRVAAVGV
jgi:hypothetical protein